MNGEPRKMETRVSILEGVSSDRLSPSKWNHLKLRNDPQVNVPIGTMAHEAILEKQA